VIVAAGLSPAWQQILAFDGLRLGEVNRAREAVWCASGKVLNVGLSLAHLGGPCVTIAPLGGLPRAEIEREFTALGAPARWIACAAPTRTCTTLRDSAAGTTTELVENAGPLSPAELAAFRAAYVEEASRAELVVLSGSLPAGTPTTFYRDLLEQTPCPAIVDARGPELLATLDRRPLVVKPNRAELARTVGRDLGDDAALLSAMRELNSAGAQWALITQGKQAVWLTSQETTHRLLPPKVNQVVNPIGCGDALAAAVAWALARGADPLLAARTGLAAAAERLGQLLPGRLDPQRVLARLDEVVIEKC
jgi:tagatose 6-phosphate kinase